MSWSAKVALVTGGSGGLGLAIAAAFAEAGCHVVIAARDGEKLAAAESSLRTRFGDRVSAIAADVTQDAEVSRLVGEVMQLHGRLDVLVNNVGRSARGEVLAATPEDIRYMLEINLLTAVRCTRAAVPHLLATGGHIVNIGSLASKAAARFLGAYPASKFALAGYTHQLRLELEPQGLHVLLVCPGPICAATPGTAMTKRRPICPSLPAGQGAA